METTTRPRLRADARANVERILAAAIEVLGVDPTASVGEIARVAGVGRVTLYGHFATRDALVQEALAALLADGEGHLREVDLAGDPLVAMRVLIESSWLLMAQASSVLVAAQAALGPETVRDLHAPFEERVDGLIRRGQQAGSFRDDQPSSWLAGVLHHLMKGAASDVAAGRLDREAAPELLVTTVMAAFAPPR